MPAFAQEVECDEARRGFLREPGDARRRRVDALLKRVEVEPARGHHDDLAIQHAARRQRVVQRLLQLGEVPVQRLEVAALQEGALAGAKHDGAKAVPFRLEEEAGLVGDRVGDLREHGLDGR